MTFALKKCVPVSAWLFALCSLSGAELLAQSESVKPGINASFAAPKVAEFVERFESEGREVYDHRKRIIAAVEAKPGMIVADVGAGTGLFTRMLAEQVGPEGTVVAVDIAKEFVDHVVASSREQGLTQVRGVVCRQDSVELPDGSVEVVFICDTYHHFEFPYKTMRSIWKALKPGGRVVLVEFHREEGKSSDWILNHVRAGQDVFVSEIERSGFEVVSEKDFLETSYLMTFSKSLRTEEEGYTVDTLDEVREGLTDGTALLLDVREQREWDAGRVKDALFSPLSVMQTHELRQTLEELNLPKDRILYTYCRAGIRSLTARKLLQQQGYDVRALREGFTELKQSGFPTE